jgi:hypothetical protein
MASMDTQDKPTEKEKMIAGELYYAFDKTLLDERQVGAAPLVSCMLLHSTCCTGWP